MNNQYLFNVKYYEGLYDGKNEEKIKIANQKLLSTLLTEDQVISFKGPKGSHSFLMKTVYPGLLIGTGNPHSSGDNSEEIKLGFTLDYTTGLPYIPGSTVKGVIRSVFKAPDKKRSDESNEQYGVRREEYENRKAYLREQIASLTKLNTISDETITALENELFEERNTGKGFVFFDAFPVRGGANNKLFAYESITPHKPLKNPVPLRLLKVIPDVVYEFRFVIHDSETIQELNASNIAELFKSIISDFGMGAKTNVGFGVMTEWDGKEAAVVKLAERTEQKSERSYGFSGNQYAKESVRTTNEAVDAMVTGYNEKKTTARLETSDKGKAQLYFKNVPGAEFGKIDEKLPLETNVRIKYLGIDPSNGFDQWELVEIIG